MALEQKLAAHILNCKKKKKGREWDLGVTRGFETSMPTANDVLFLAKFLHLLRQHHQLGTI